MKETNMEHYRNEILEAIKDDTGFGKREGKIMPCSLLCPVNKCDFSLECAKNRTLWMMAEYKPELTLTAKEKHMVELIETGWLVRDSDGDVCWHNYKPYKNSRQWVFPHEDISEDDFTCFDEGWNKKLFKFITWEDEEPWAVEDLRKLKVQE